MNKLTADLLERTKGHGVTSARAKELGFGKWMVGKRLSEITKQKISIALKGGNSGSFKKGEHRSISTEFKQGNIAPNFGRKLPSISGSNHYNWKGGITAETRKERDRFHKYFTPKVFKRDDYTCQLCKKRGAELQVDHIKKWSEYPELRFDLTNCRTLCKACHYLITFNKPLMDKTKKFGSWK